MMNNFSMFVCSELYQGHYYLPELAKAAGLTNAEAASVAAVERVNLDTPNDERHPQHYDINLTACEQFPYIKTRSGAMQRPVMPWDYKRRETTLSLVALSSALLGLACKVAK